MNGRTALISLTLVAATVAHAQSPQSAKPTSGQSQSPADLQREVLRLRAENDSLRTLLSTKRFATSVSAAPATREPKAAENSAIPDRPHASHPGTVTSEYDRFKDYTAVHLTDMKLSSGINFDAFYLMPGQEPKVPATVVFLFHASSSDWQYLRCHNVDLLLDGKPLQVGDAKHDGTVGNGYVIEHISLQMAVSSLLAIAASKQVDGRICRTEFRLDTPELTALTDFASRMKTSLP